VGGTKTLIIPTITADDGDQPTWTSTIINDATLRAQHEAAIVNLVLSKHYDGIDLDYEHLQTTDRAAFSTFAAELSALLHAQGKTLSFAVGAETVPGYSHWRSRRISCTSWATTSTISARIRGRSRRSAGCSKCSRTSRRSRAAR
jgi:spore germination protein YaaH